MQKRNIRFKIGLIITVLLLLLIWFFWPRPIVSNPVSSVEVYYDISVLYGPEHQNEYHLYDEDSVYSSDKEETAYPMDAALQEKLENVLAKYTMRRTISFDNQLRVYNLTRFSGPVGYFGGAHFMNICLNYDEGLVQIGHNWYRIRDPEMLTDEIQPLIDEYLSMKEKEGPNLTGKSVISLKEAATLLADPDKGGDAILTITGNGITDSIPEDYYQMRVALWAFYGESDPVGKALDSMKREVLEKSFAKEHDLIPTKKEIREYVQNERQTVDSTLESSAITSKLIESLGFTEDYYWNEYKPTYEAEAALIHSKVSQYIEANDQEEIDLSQAEYEIFDKEKFDRIKKQYQ